MSKQAEFGRMSVIEMLLRPSVELQRKQGLSWFGVSMRSISIFYLFPFDSLDHPSFAWPDTPESISTLFFSKLKYFTSIPWLTQLGHRLLILGDHLGRLFPFLLRWLDSWITEPRILALRNSQLSSFAHAWNLIFKVSFKVGLLC